MKSIQEIPFHLAELQVFVAVCESGSMTEAARLLGVSQSAVSQQLKSMEDRCGMTLLDRDFRPSRPTGTGRLLLDLAKELLALATRMTLKIADASRAGEMQIRLGCVDSFAATVGPSLVKAISGPNRQITMFSGLTPLLSEQIQGRELDMAIVTETQVKDVRILQTPLLSEAFVAAVPKSYGKQGADFRAAAEALPLIRYTARSVIGQQVDRYIQHIGIESSRRFAFDATDPMLSMVASGLGWAVTTPLCLWQARHYVKDIRILPLPRSEIGARKFFLLSREDEWSALSGEVLQLTQQVLKKHTIPEIRSAIPMLDSAAIRCL